MLNRDAILDAAIEVINEEGGPEHLSMRAVARRLDVTAAAIYHYFEGRDELVEALVERVCAAIVAEAPDDGEWPERLRALMTGLVDHALTLPSASLWAITAYARRPAMLRLHEAILGVLAEAGFTPQAAVQVKGALLRLCVGHLTLHRADPGHRWRELPGNEFPHYRAAGPALDDHDDDPGRVFRIGLDALLVGIAAGPLAPSSTGV